MGVGDWLFGWVGFGWWGVVCVREKGRRVGCRKVEFIYLKRSGVRGGGANRAGLLRLG